MSLDDITLLDAYDEIEARGLLNELRAKVFARAKVLKDSADDVFDNAKTVKAFERAAELRPHPAKAIDYSWPGRRIQLSTAIASLLKAEKLRGRQQDPEREMKKLMLSVLPVVDQLAALDESAV